MTQPGKTGNTYNLEDKVLFNAGGNEKKNAEPATKDTEPTTREKSTRKLTILGYLRDYV